MAIFVCNKTQIFQPKKDMKNNDLCEKKNISDRGNKKSSRLFENLEKKAPVKKVY